jgi:uncharacterized phosphosugar-binding protein
MGTYDDFMAEVTDRLPALKREAESGTIKQAIDLMTDAVAAGGVIRAFGTGHSEAFCMELAGRAGGLIPTSRMALKDMVIYGDKTAADLTPELERDPSFAEELFALYPRDPRDIYVVVSNSGVNGSIVGVALAAKQAGHTVIAVTSLQHTAGVTSKHPSGKKLSDVGDVVIDNLAPYGDTTLTLESGYVMGAVSSITGAVIAQLMTLGITEQLAARGLEVPVFISANIPGGDEHNNALKERYEGRLRLDG